MPLRRLQRLLREQFGFAFSRRAPYVRRGSPHRPPDALQSLDPSYLAPTVWKRDPNASLPSDEFHAFFARHHDGHKWHHYFDFYVEVLTPYRRPGVRMLEIGVDRGGSVRMWKHWFGEEATIVGVDINPGCRAHEDVSRKIHVRIGDQGDAAFLKRVTDEFGPFDIINDDGSHKTSHMIASFNALFADALKPGGLYVAEDTHTNYWFNWRDTPHSFIDFARALVDAMHAHYPAHQNEVGWRRGPNELAQVTVPAITPWLEEIRFRDSLVAIRKGMPRALPVSEYR